jgi:septal ring factor EnvC (AmiA/AmiB activator)
MAKSAMTPDALAYRATAAPFRVAIGLALAVSAGVMLWGVGTHCVSASEFAPDAARETPVMTIEDRVAALMAELAQIKAENAKLRESQSDTSEELSRIRASLANAEIGIATLRTTTDENEAHRRDTAVQIASNLAQLKEDTLHLHMVQDDEIGSLRARVANSEIGVESLRSARPQAKSASKSSASRLVGTRPARSPRDTSISARRSGWRSTEPHVVTLDIYR